MGEGKGAEGAWGGGEENEAEIKREGEGKGGRREGNGGSMVEGEGKGEGEKGEGDEGWVAGWKGRRERGMEVVEMVEGKEEGKEEGEEGGGQQVKKGRGNDIEGEAEKRMGIVKE